MSHQPRWADAAAARRRPRAKVMNCTASVHRQLWSDNVGGDERWARMAGEFEDALASCTAERALVLRRLATSQFVRPQISTFRMLDFDPDDSQTPRKL